MSQPPQFNTIAEAMNHLANGRTDPDDIAQYLRELGCRGEARSDAGCPIAVYLLKTVKDLGIVYVGKDITSGRYDPNLLQEEAITPNVVMEFIINFDMFYYKYLVGLD